MRLPVRETPLRVPGFRFAGVACGIKQSGRLDLALIASDVPAVAAGVFTRNRVKAAPVVIATRHVRRGRARAVLVNSGNANACTGAAGMRVATAACRHAGAALGIAPADVLPCSTGKIGVPLPAGPLLRGIDAAAAALAPDGLWRAAHAMLTTDAFPKVARARIRLGGRVATIAGLAKGAGMIAPDMATLLVCLLTDARVAAPVLRRLLADTVATSFNAITVDGDTSTNDTVLALANGAAGNRPFAAASADGRRFARGLGGVMGTLADMVVADGEGATKRVQIRVTGARSDAEARQIARAVAESQLVRTALHGADPNWGRIVCAAGYAGASLRPERLSVGIGARSSPEPSGAGPRRQRSRGATAGAGKGSVAVLRSGVPAGGRALARAAAIMRRPTFAIALDVGCAGRGRATIVTSDLSPAYVKFNAAYST